MMPPERKSAKQLERKFEQDESISDERPSVVFQQPNIDTDKQKLTIQYPKRLDVTIYRQPHRMASTYSNTSQVGQVSLNYEDIRVIKQITMIDKISKFLHIDKCRCPYSGSCEMALKWLGNTPQESDAFRKKCQHKTHNRQIKLDVERTVPLQGFEEKQNILHKLLQACSHDYGYMQGMNMIGSVLVYHSEGVIAYTLMIKLFNLLNLRDLYDQKVSWFIKTYLNFRFSSIEKAT